ncbi:MAG TPA: RNA polymerase sigma factor [Terriglobia bacterium]|nr:RNA polymerase sigma factor [Terriglobia bacterium]
MGAGLELQLVARAQQGDHQAFTVLFNRHKVRVYSLCLRMTGNPASAEDLTQDAFLQLFLKISTFRGEAAFSTWLHRLVVNVVLVHLRRKVLQVVSLEDVDWGVEGPHRHQYGSDDLRLRSTLERINLAQALDLLPKGYRTAIHLHDVEGYQHCEIARLAKWSVGTSKSQLYKARRRLRQLLASGGRNPTRRRATPSTRIYPTPSAVNPPGIAARRFEFGNRTSS